MLTLIKNISIIASGSFLVQIIAVLSLPLLTRIYDEVAFGMFSLYGSVVSVFMVGIALKFDSTVLISRSSLESRFLAQIALVLSLFFGSASLIAFILFQEAISHLLNSEILFPWFYFVPASIVFGSWIQTFTFLNNRQSNFKAGAITKITQITTQICAQLSISSVLPTGGLVVGRLSGTVISLFYLRHATTFKLSIPKYNHLKIYRKLIWKYRKYPTFGMLGSFSDNLAIQLPILCVTRNFSLSDLGFFALAVKVLTLPSRLISVAVSTVLVNEVVKDFADNPARLKRKLVRLLILNIIMYFPVFIIVFLYAEVIFEVVFGEGWARAGEIAEILVVSAYLKFVISPLSAIFAINQNLKTGVIWQIGYLITLAIALNYNSSISLLEYAILYVCADVLMYILYFVVIYKTIKKQERVVCVG